MALQYRFLQEASCGAARKIPESRLKKATVEFLGRGEGYCGKIPGFSGLIVFGDTKKEVLAELESALEGWMEIALKKGIGLPSLKDEEKQLV